MKIPRIYDSDRQGLKWLEEAKALWTYRHLVRELVARDIKVRYKRSVLGVAWTMLSPLLSMLALTFVFSLVLRMDIKNYPVYFLTGSIFWTFFAQSTGGAASLTLEALSMTKLIYVPRSVFVISAIGGGLVNLVLSLVPLAAIILVSGFPIHASWLFLPVSIVLGALFATGVGLFVFTLACRFVDIKETYLVLVGAWFFVTPIVYTAKYVPERYRFVIRLNPMTYLVEIFRAPLYDGWLPGPNTLVFAVGVSLASLVVGWIVYSAKIEDYARRG
jgi:ABC-2 type transport system permease protein